MDVGFLDRALDRAFQLVSVDAARLVIGGFSDGASYALSFGLANGDLFPRIMALSPGFIVEGPRIGKPEVFLAHGTRDSIIPIDRSSRRMAPSLRKRGYTVNYREFDGDHEMLDPVMREAMQFVIAPPT